MQNSADTHNLPSFFIDDSDSDKFEETIDFFLSWTFRCAAVEYRESNPRLNEYAKKIISYLLFKDQNVLKGKSIEWITVERQYSRVDLWVEIKLTDLDNLYALIIENKM